MQYSKLPFFTTYLIVNSQIASEQRNLTSKISLLFNGKNTKNTLKESTTFYLLSIANLKTDLFVSRLLSEPTSG